MRRTPQMTMMRISPRHARVYLFFIGVSIYRFLRGVCGIYVMTDRFTGGIGGACIENRCSVFFWWYGKMQWGSLGYRNGLV